MGGGPPSENLLIILPFPEDTEKTNEIKKRFDDVDVTYFMVGGMGSLTGEGDGDKVGEKLRLLFKQATILATLGHWPEKPEDAPNLKLIHLFSAGIDHFSTHPIYLHTTIPITTSSGIHGPPISEWILGSTLFLRKHLATTYENQKSHQTRRDAYNGQEDWVGKSIGVAGYGSIGRQVARVFVAMGSQVVAYTAGPRPTKESRRDNGYIVPGTGDPEGQWPVAWYSGTDRASLETFLRAGLDALIVCVPLTDATRKMLGREEFEILKSANAGKGCFLVNISRGGIIRQDELVDCLNDGTLSGAALDVTDPEPLPEDSGLWDAKNCVVSPHVSALGVEYMGRAYDVLMVNLGVLEGKGERKGFVNEVKRKKGY